jgi:hypothetical protein
VAADQPGPLVGNDVTARRGRTRQCNRADARVRLDDASRFLAAVDALETSAVHVGNDVLATNAIHAAIAAVDAYCCATLGQRSASGDHSDAAALLQGTDRKLGADFAKVLGYKNAAAYETRETTDDEVKTCRRVAAKLIEAAQKALQAAGSI